MMRRVNLLLSGLAEKVVVKERNPRVFPSGGSSPRDQASLRVVSCEGLEG